MESGTAGAGGGMKGVVYRGPGRVAVEELPLPVLQGPRDAIVRVTRAAVCGTDLHPYRGELPDFAPGTVLGHEFAGVVHSAGPEARFRPGDRVFASDVVACGRCAQCARGLHYQCAEVSLFGYADVVGKPVDGGQAEFVRVPFADVVLGATPADVSDEQGLFVGDVLTTAYAAVRNAGVQAGDRAAVVGAGPVGLLAALCARLAGAVETVVADTDGSRRARAETLGFRAVDPAEPSAALAVGPGGAQRVVEAVGTDAALRFALETAGAGATIAVAGSHHSTAMPFPTGLAFAREWTLRFTVGDPITLRDEVLGLVRDGSIDPCQVVSDRVPLVAAPEAYEAFDQRRAFKTVLEIG
ncbi:alcohol dehydrogenase catalytic domain-containing protein [Streptomyces sp. NPDC051684]|uniref:alcohol dehydrogenase catalytic domain-containing protein n=1 Tax=Streptomyces sp. NPDC051684 TaxID=3365670 RepID=UPI0037961CA2